MIVRLFRLLRIVRCRILGHRWMAQRSWLTDEDYWLCQRCDDREAWTPRLRAGE